MLLRLWRQLSEVISRPGFAGRACVPESTGGLSCGVRGITPGILQQRMLSETADILLRERSEDAQPYQTLPTEAFFWKRGSGNEGRKWSSSIEGER